MGVKDKYCNPFRQPPSFQFVRSVNYTSLLLRSVALQQRTLSFTWHNGSIPKPPTSPAREASNHRCQTSLPTDFNSATGYSKMKVTFRIRYSGLRVEIKNKYYTKLRPAKKKIQINQAKQVGSAVSHPLSFFYFLLTVR